MFAQQTKKVIMSNTTSLWKLYDNNTKIIEKQLLPRVINNKKTKICEFIECNKMFFVDK